MPNLDTVKDSILLGGTAYDGIADEVTGQFYI